MNNVHSVYYDGEQTKFKCGEELVVTFTGDANISIKECPVCRKPFKTTGYRQNKRIISLERNEV